MRKRSVSIMSLLFLVCGLVGIDVRPASALSSVESCFYRAINRERAHVGRHSLALKSDLTYIARRHSRRMAADGTIYHNDNLGNEIPGRWYAAGENVGMGPDCQSIHDAFMASPGHKANILDRDYNQVGVGVAMGDDGTVYVTEDFAGRRSTVVHRPVIARRPTARPTAAAPPKPRKPVPPLVAAEPRTIDVLLLLLGLDARRVDATTGEAMGI
jgi:cysteine-rich secretory family protein